MIVDKIITDMFYQFRHIWFDKTGIKYVNEGMNRLLTHAMKGLLTRALTGLLTHALNQGHSEENRSLSHTD